MARDGLKLHAHIGAALLVVLAFYLSSRYSYLLFHTLIEVVTASVGFALFALTWNARRFLDTGFLKILGIGYGFIACIDLIHGMAYKGMNIFPGYDANLPTQLWIAARYAQAATLVAALAFVRRDVEPLRLLGIFFAATVAILAATFGGAFPDCFVEGRGLTPFKIASEYVITAVLLGLLVPLHAQRHDFSRDVYRMIVASIVFTALSELSFTAYASVYGFANMLGHLFKLAAFYLIYRALLVTGFSAPFELIFRDLKQAEERLRRAHDTLEDKVRQRTAELSASEAELRQAEARVRELNRDLERRVAERTAQLEAANKELEAFSYSVSHDLRAPLRAIDGFSQALVEDCGDRLGSDASHCLDAIRRNARRMGDLIDDILDFSRMSRREIVPARIDMTAMFREVFEEVRGPATARNIDFRLGELPPAQGDRALIRQVVVNLLSNAVKFTSRREAAVIEVSAAVEGEQNLYCVEDNGAGFEMAYVDRLFGVFQRLHGPEEFEGIGIGLAIVKRIVGRHGGRVSAEGEVDQGARFCFTLPRA